jgi:peptidyl-prolyl cis-trans isomerase C
MRRYPLLAVPALVVTLAAGCRRATTPAAKPADGGAPAGASVPQAPSAGQPPAGQAPGAPPGLPGPVPVKPVPAVLPAVLAKVNGEDVQKWELDTALKQAEASAGSAVPADKRDVVLRNILDELINYHMLAQEARGMKIQATDAEVDAQLATIRKNFPTDEAYQQALLMQGVTIQQLRDLTRRTLDAQKLVDTQVTSKIAVQDADVNAFYNQNIERFKQGDTVHASHIFIAVPPNAVPAQKEQARATAERILKQLRAGADFATLAKTESNDASAANGGDLGFIAKGDVPPDFEKAAFGLKPGTTSGVVELESGFHIIKVSERRGPRTAPLAEVREDVKGFLKQQQTQAKLAEYIGQVKAKTKIQVLV